MVLVFQLPVADVAWALPVYQSVFNTGMLIWFSNSDAQ